MGHNQCGKTNLGLSIPGDRLRRNLETHLYVFQHDVSNQHSEADLGHLLQVQSAVCQVVPDPQLVQQAVGTLINLGPKDEKTNESKEKSLVLSFPSHVQSTFLFWIEEDNQWKDSSARALLLVSLPPFLMGGGPSKVNLLNLMAGSRTQVALNL